MLLLSAPLLDGCRPGARADTERAQTAPATAPDSEAEGELPSANAEPKGELLVLAAASLKETFDVFAYEFEQRYPKTRLRCTFAGSQALRAQIEQGARADVFVSASPRHSEALYEAGLVERPAVVATNRLCVAARIDQNMVEDLSDLAKPGVRIVVATSTCPVGAYARRCWGKMAAAPQFGPDFTRALEANVVSNETDVKLVLAKVQLGEADAGFVYTSDVRGEDMIAVWLPDEVAVEATYEVAVGTEGLNPTLARQFVAELLAESGAKALKMAGLTPGNVDSP